MSLLEALWMSLENIAGHKLRSGLTMLGIVFGVGAVIAMLAIGAGAERQALESISRLGLHNVVVRAEEMRDDVLKEVRVSSPGVSLRDAEAIRDAVPGVRLVAPKVELDPYAVLAAEASLETGDATKVLGVDHRHAELIDLELAEGRFLDALDVRDHAQVAVIGDGVRRDLFGYQPALGAHLKVNDVWLEVIGVVASEAGGEVDALEGVQVVSLGRAIYIPVSTALRKFDRRPLDSPLTEIVVRMDEKASSQLAASAIASLLEQLHAGEEDYQLVVPEALLEESRRTQRMFNLVMGCIAGISLLVGGIGIMNIMLASVLERTREIGVRRAVGARRRDILVQFMIESFALSAIGGLVGISMGVLIAKIVAASAGWPTLVQPWAIVLATGVAVSVGLISGLYPAMRAAELDPIESLRHE